MRFDARVAGRLPSGEHMTFEGFPGLRLQASMSCKSSMHDTDAARNARVSK